MRINFKQVKHIKCEMLTGTRGCMLSEIDVFQAILKKSETLT